MSTFQDREEAVNQICANADQGILLNVYGEAGIGKSRLLSEAVQQLRTKSPPSPDGSDILRCGLYAFPSG